eukprot:9807071-Alexandrium_andersonii.AAC.1
MEGVLGFLEIAGAAERDHCGLRQVELEGREELVLVEDGENAREVVEVAGNDRRVVGEGQDDAF